MINCEQLGLVSGKYIPLNNRSINEGYISSIYGQICCSQTLDLDLDDLKTLKSTVVTTGPLLITPCSSLATNLNLAAVLKYGPEVSQSYEPTDEQKRAISGLAKIKNPNNIFFRKLRKKEALKQLPSLVVADLLITPESLYLKEDSAIDPNKIPDVIRVDTIRFAIAAAKSAVTKLRQ